MINQYAVLNRLGQGANCKVYLVKDTNNNEYYAAKVIHLSRAVRSPTRIQNLEREIRMMKLMSSEYVIKLHEVLYAEKKCTAYLIMEWADCGTLQNVIEKNTELNEETIKKTFLQVVKALEFVHSHGVVHQDIKPSNIMLLSNGKVKLGDFGIGHSFQSADTVIGSPAYQAPEVFDDLSSDFDNLPELDPAKEDVWSLGVTLFETTFHRLPFTGDNVYEIPRYIKEHGLIIPNSISHELEDLLRGMLCPCPEKRLSLAEVKVHPFFNGVVETDVVLASKTHAGSINPSLIVDKATATVCDDKFCFGTVPNSFPELNINLSEYSSLPSPL